MVLIVTKIVPSIAEYSPAVRKYGVENTRTIVSAVTDKETTRAIYGGDLWNSLRKGRRNDMFRVATSATCDGGMNYMCAEEME